MSKKGEKKKPNPSEKNEYNLVYNLSKLQIYIFKHGFVSLSRVFAFN